MSFIQTIIDLLSNLFGGGAASADAPDPTPDNTTATTSPAAETPSNPADLGSGGGDSMTGVTSHALVLPDADFRSWYEATRDYTAHFDNVIIVRSPAGNNLNRYKVITAVSTGRVWFNGDPVGHIRRAYPNVVTVDVAKVTTPTTLKILLDARVAANTRLGADTDTRFTLDWPTDGYTLRIVREFDVPMGNGFFHEGVDIAADPGTVVRSACSGTVFAVTTADASLGYGTFVQVQARGGDGSTYLITYTQLTNIAVSQGQAVTEGDMLGTCASDWGIKLVVSKAGTNTGSRYRASGVIDPVPLLYVDGIALHT
ncbi:MAG: M23 family metallopeptidase, partial [Chloroflexota bacterium]